MKKLLLIVPLAALLLGVAPLRNEREFKDKMRSQPEVVLQKLQELMPEQLAALEEAINPVPVYQAERAILAEVSVVLSRLSQDRPALAPLLAAFATYNNLVATETSGLVNVEETTSYYEEALLLQTKAHAQYPGNSKLLEDVDVIVAELEKAMNDVIAIWKVASEKARLAATVEEFRPDILAEENIENAAEARFAELEALIKG